MFRLILDQFLEADPARGAAAGWDGDSVQLFEGAEGELALWIRSVWDTEQDAAEFVEAYEDLIRLKYGPAGLREAPDGAPARRLWRTETDVLILERAGRRVDLLEAALQGRSGGP